MTQYIVEVLIGLQTVRKYVVDQLGVAEMLAENIQDDLTDVIIREVRFG